MAAVYIAERPDYERPSAPHRTTAEWRGGAWHKRGRVVCSCGYMSTDFYSDRAEIYVTTLLLKHKRIHSEP